MPAVAVREGYNAILCPPTYVCTPACTYTQLMCELPAHYALTIQPIMILDSRVATHIMTHTLLMMRLVSTWIYEVK